MALLLTACGADEGTTEAEPPASSVANSVSATEPATDSTDTAGDDAVITADNETEDRAFLQRFWEGTPDTEQIALCMTYLNDPVTFMDSVGSSLQTELDIEQALVEELFDQKC